MACPTVTCSEGKGRLQRPHLATTGRCGGQDGCQLRMGDAMADSGLDELHSAAPAFIHTVDASTLQLRRAAVALAALGGGGWGHVIGHALLSAAAQRLRTFTDEVPCCRL